MQSLSGLSNSNFLTKDKIPLVKLEVYHDGGWLNLCDLDDKNYLEDFSVNLGGAKMLPAPVAGEWNAVINNPDGIFHPSHPTSSYADLFEEGKKVRISLGATYGDIRDDFDDASIHDRWTKDPDNDDADRTSTETTLLTMDVAANTDARWAGALNEAPKLYIPVLPVPFTVICKIPAYNMPTNNVEYGIFIGHYDADQTNQKFAYKFMKRRAGDGSKDIIVSHIHTQGGLESGSDIYSALDEDADLWFKIAVDADEDVRFYVSDDGESWYQMRKSGSPYAWSGFFDSGMEIGLFLAGNVAPAITGTFEYFLMDGDYDFYWQRLIGYMEEPSYEEKARKVNISGYDYMKLLIDTELRKEDNETWGSTETFSSVASEGTLGAEKYAELDAMEIGGNEANSVASWTPSANITIVSQADTGGGSTWVGKINTAVIDPMTIRNTNVGTLVVGSEYKLVFKYRKVHGSNYPMALTLLQTVGTETVCGGTSGMLETDWTTITIYFKAIVSGALIMQFEFGDEDQEWRIDEISLKEHTAGQHKTYDMPSTCNGIYKVTLDAVEVFQEAGPEGWFYDVDLNIFYFNKDKVVATGTDNIVVYYFTDQTLENVVADLLVKAGLYADQAAALTGMSYTATSIAIPQLFFKAGTSCLEAIRLCCERAEPEGYRFFFQYDGTPDFNPAPTAKITGSEDIDLHEGAYSEPSYYRDKSEIWNRVVIEGLEQGQRVAPASAMESELRGEENDSDSIDEYGEKTKTIKNHLFQTQTAIDAMCVTLLALRKDPKYYFDSTLPFNPLPLEIGDTMRQQIPLAVGTGKKYNQFVYGDGTKYGGGEVVVVRRGLIRDISISRFDVQYKCEEVT